MFDLEAKKKAKETALLVGIQGPETTAADAEELLTELADLVDTLGLDVVGRQVVKLREFQSRYLIGQGKAEELAARMDEEEIDCLIFDDTLSPSQQRNWEELTKRCAIDRQEVILEIFAEHATTREAVLQVGLARMEYSLPRLKRAWTHLSRQRGGAKGTRGKGETQLESDRRMVLTKIDRLKGELVDVQKARQTRRKRREKVPVPVAAIVGYTNAGKSSLLNRLTQADVLVEDKLFATLDATTRRIRLENQPLLLSDTVGFVRKLPHGLIEAFKSTLEEAVLADFLIHVLDVTSEHVATHEKTTLEVLEELGAHEKPMITVFNKIDRLQDPDKLILLRASHPGAIYLSAKSGEGLDLLRREMSARLRGALLQLSLRIPAERYDLVSQLHRQATVLSEEHHGAGIDLVVLLAPKLVAPFEAFLRVDPDETRHDAA
ncbi:MAG: GTPase HflX [Myxococcales bacterium]|nr:GTPase HflX [Myxococcales bacterium]